MTRVINQAFRDAFYGDSTGEAAIILLTIDHDDLAEPLYLALNSSPINSRGMLFLPYFFVVNLPEQAPDRMPIARLSVDAVDRRVIEALRGLSQPPEVKIEVVLESAPNTVILVTPNFVWRGVTYTQGRMEGDLEGPQVYSSSYPSESFSPSVARGLFKAVN